MDIKRNRKGQFTKNNNSGKRFTSETMIGNKFAKGNPPNSGSFKVGDRIMEKHPSWKGGVQNIKNDCCYVTIGPNQRIRRPKHVWESVYGELPKGYVLYHKDGNKKNDSIENLEAITRAELMVRNHSKQLK